MHGWNFVADGIRGRGLRPVWRAVCRRCGKWWGVFRTPQELAKEPPLCRCCRSK